MNWRDAFELASFVVTGVALPLLLRGEAPQFQTYIKRVAQEERGTTVLTAS